MNSTKYITTIDNYNKNINRLMYIAAILVYQKWNIKIMKTAI